MADSAILKYIKLKDYEEIKEIIRPSTWSYFWQILIIIFLIILPFFLIYPLFQMKTTGIIIFSVLIVVSLFFAIRTYFTYYFTALVLTNIRIIDMAQKGLFNRSVSSALYSKVEDVYSQSRGLFKTILKTGNVYINLSGKRTVKLKFQNVKYPQQMVDKIIFLQEDFLKNTPNHSNAEYLLRKIKRKIGPEEFDKLISD